MEHYISDYKNGFKWVKTDPLEVAKEKRRAKEMKKDLTEVHFHHGNKTEENFESIFMKDFHEPDVEILKKNKEGIIKGKKTGLMNQGGFRILDSLPGQYNTVYREDFSSKKGLSKEEMANQKREIQKNMIASHFDITFEGENIKKSLYKQDFDQKDYCKRNPVQVKKMTEILRQSNINFGMTRDHGEVYHASIYKKQICHAKIRDNLIQKTHLEKKDVSINFRNLILEDLKKEQGKSEK